MKRLSQSVYSDEAESSTFLSRQESFLSGSEEVDQRQSQIQMESQSLLVGSEEADQPKCDVCQVQSVTSEAISYCTSCLEHLCRSCDKAHRRSKASKHHVLTTGSNTQSGSSALTQASFNTMGVVGKQDIDGRTRTIYGCTFMSNGHIVLACGNDGLKVFDNKFRCSHEISVYSLDVAAVNTTDVIITQGYLSQLTVYRVVPSMERKEVMELDRRCYGVDVYGAEIYVTCHDNPGKGVVLVLNMDGKVQRIFGVTDGRHRTTTPGCVKVSKDGSKVFVSDWDSNSVTCFDKQGHVINTLSKTPTDLKAPIGMCLDEDDNVFVCGWLSHNVHVIKHDGTVTKIVLSRSGGIKYPFCISYRQKNKCLIVGLCEKDDDDKKLIKFILQ